MTRVYVALIEAMIWGPLVSRRPERGPGGACRFARRASEAGVPRVVIGERFTEVSRRSGVEPVGPGRRRGIEKKNRVRR